MSEVKRYWIYKGTSNFCQVLIMNDDYTDMIKQKPDGFYDIVSTNDTVEGGVEVVLASDYEKLKAQLERAEAVISFYGDENSWYLQKDPVTGSEIRRSIDFFDTESFGFQDTPESRNILKVFGGKRAREYFKEKEEV